MVNISGKLNTTGNLLNTRHTEIPVRKQFTYRLPMGGVGDNCIRRLQYSFFNCFLRVPVEPRIQRLFNFGTFAEELIIRELEEAGLTVSGQQTGLVGTLGHAYGYNDGIIEGLPEAPNKPHVLELKTHNDKNFKVLTKKGVRAGFVSHYDQCQRYMLALELDRALYIGYNKNDSDLYVERLEFNKSYAQDLERKELMIIASTELASRLEGKDDYKCTYCPAKGICKGHGEIHHNCRNCTHVDLEDGGKWYCNHHMMDLERDQQNEGCASWSMAEMFKGD